ncbi:concanavalin A-like lectin/glucanase domain-containing protein [Mucor mucedo]|uniref:concanavalin A-like lectin/glucanase domain-containing protein n=1 Tax=Mucor mucedo TaxID=29922 RepID=UPI00221F12B8|nr:concanavalin A-like lectin/glucanase domain-containing protein [Mucor mucedo]KAI7891797.1 concanavalin A-like lectin/glucanase domain-containing protein [Mucor mucedo]
MSSEAPTYNSAFPALNAAGLMNIQNRQSIQQGSSALPRAIHHPLAPPKIPSYLKQTKYAALVLEQYNYQQNKYHLKSTKDEELEQLDLRLPTFWNSKDKSKNIDVGTNGLDLSYSYLGPGQKESDAALVRANFPMRPQCGIFYFEMKVISKGNDGYIGIGFCCASNKLERLPGWDLESWGYHGDDGHSFGGSGTGKNYGPCFTTGDVIGCGVNFSNSSAFYTKNGRHLGIAFKDMVIDKPVYPAIGLRTPGEQVTANFGHEPFVFDIEQYIKDQKIRVIEDITKSPTANKYFDSNTVVKSQDRDMYSKEVMDQLVLSYLIHHGYTGTAKAVVQNAGHVSGQELFLSDAHNEISQQGEQDMEERQSKERRLSYAEMAASLSPSSSTELPKTYSSKEPHCDTEMMDIDSSNDGKTAESLKHVMEYGQKLQEEYRHDTRDKTRSCLVEIFSLLAYRDPDNSPVAYLMDISRRDALATEVNAAILGKL